MNELVIPFDDYLRIKVTPKSRTQGLSEILTEPDGEKTYKIRIKSAPEKGKANNELIEYLSQYFQIHKDQISILSGKTDQIKLIKINK